MRFSHEDSVRRYRPNTTESVDKLQSMEIGKIWVGEDLYGNQSNTVIWSGDDFRYIRRGYNESQLMFSAISIA